MAQLHKLELGTLRIVGDIVLGDRSRQYVAVRCTACDATRDILVDNLVGGKTRNCRCQRGLKYRHPEARLIGARYDAIVRRCGNPADRAFKNYGALGIECRFADRRSFVDFILLTFPRETYADLQIDRIINEGHYEPGNIHLVPAAENLRNKSNTRWVDYGGANVVAADLYDLLKQDYPDFSLSPGTTAKLAAAGVPVAEILRRKPRARRG